MNSLNCSVLVHTFNQYERYWDGFLKGFHENFDAYLPCHFGTDVMFHMKREFGRFKVIYSGEGEWSDRLINLLNQIDTEYIFYIQEDMWPSANPPNLDMLLNFIKKNDIYRLQISPVVQFYSLYGSELPLFFHYKSKYLVSHQPSIWKKSFLLECLKPNENPWQNEYEGTKRLNIPEINGKIAIYPHDWFTHECISKQNITK